MADDPVVAYEGGVTSCHGAPQRECCVRAGLAAVRAADQLHAALLAFWRYWHHEAGPVDCCQYVVMGIERDDAAELERLSDAVAELLAKPEPESGATEGWGAMVRHGGRNPSDDRTDRTE